eukprot:NODE_3200_length_803_cov_83.401857_g2671_i0.p1 GENE.NODE_3200_length_803_cov_83.401857_g2671_i0~~NODE_3200_length_803_cov_83.401857_g2671_i0.p1  ORF type:complete len:244 (+),score=50.24 NODE_3200_length_803_cov_83.401857_g2671_i0:51-734(+)
MVQDARPNVAGYTLHALLQLLSGLASHRPQQVGVSGYQRVQTWIQLLLEGVEFLGENANVMAAHYGPDSKGRTESTTQDGVHSNPRVNSIISTLTGLVGLQKELTHACVHALATFAFRSNYHVRICCQQALEELTVDGENHDNSIVILPVMEILDKLSVLQRTLSQLISTESQNRQLLVEFLSRHEHLKGLISLYCTLRNSASFKLLGKPSRAVLEKAYLIKHSTAE